MSEDQHQPIDLDKESDAAEFDPMEARVLGPLMRFIDPLKYKEVVVNTTGEVGVELLSGEWEWYPVPELDEKRLEEMSRILANKSGQLFMPSHPILSCKWPGGHRVQILSGFHTPRGFAMTVRLKREDNFTLEDFIMSDEDRDAIKKAVSGSKTILISGGTGSGKTSFLNALMPYVDKDDRIVTMEDVPELKISVRNWCPLLFAGDDTGIGTLDIAELINACLRLRPDRIILGEIRKENAFTFCSAINTGHAGSMATIHSNSPDAALDAVINRVLLNGDAMESTISVLKRQLVNDIYGVAQLTRIKGGVEGYFKVLDQNAKL